MASTRTLSAASCLLALEALEVAGGMTGSITEVEVEEEVFAILEVEEEIGERIRHKR